MKTVTIATEQKYAFDSSRSSLREHVLEFQGNRYGLVFVPPGAEARQETNGPMVPGPWAAAFGLGIVIAANREMSTGAEMRRNREAGTEHVITVGDVVVIEGFSFAVAAGRGFRPDYLRLELLNPLTAPAPKPEPFADLHSTSTHVVDAAGRTARPRDIAVRYSSIDNFRQRRVFKSLAGAQAYAARKIGETPEMGSTYAVSPDGIGRIEVDGASLAELFPALQRDLDATAEEEQLARQRGPDFDTRDREGREDARQNEDAVSAVRHYLTVVKARLNGAGPQDAADWKIIARQLRTAAALARKAGGR